MTYAVLSVRDREPGTPLRVLALGEVLEALGEDVRHAAFLVRDLVGPGRTPAYCPELLGYEDVQGVLSGCARSADGEVIAYRPGTRRGSLCSRDLALASFPENRMWFAIVVIDTTCFDVLVREAWIAKRLSERFRFVSQLDADCYF